MSTYCNYWNKVSLVKSKIKKSKKIDSIGIGLASPEEIRRWGERRLPNGTLIGKIDKDHTVDYESLKPIEGGLFCERIFGPVEDFYCSCERKGEKNEKFCPNCEVEFTKSRVRRIRMGYISLAVPVVHVWYLRGRPSYIANLVGKSRNSIDRLAYGETLSESFIGSSSLESIYKKNISNSFSALQSEAYPFGKSSSSTKSKKFSYEQSKDGYPERDIESKRLDNAKDFVQNRVQIAYPLGKPSLFTIGTNSEGIYFPMARPRKKEEIASNQYTSTTDISVAWETLRNKIRRGLWQNDGFFSSSVSLMPNQDFIIPKKLCYPKSLITSNVKNRVSHAITPLAKQRSKVVPRAFYKYRSITINQVNRWVTKATTKQNFAKKICTTKVNENFPSENPCYTKQRRGSPNGYVNKLTKCFFSHNVVTSTGFIKKTSCSHPQFISLFAVPSQKIIQNLESVRFAKPTYFSKPIVVSTDIPRFAKGYRRCRYTPYQYISSTLQSNALQQKSFFTLHVSKAKGLKNPLLTRYSLLLQGKRVKEYVNEYIPSEYEIFPLRENPLPLYPFRDIRTPTPFSKAWHKEYETLELIPSEYTKQRKAGSTNLIKNIAEGSGSTLATAEGPPLALRSKAGAVEELEVFGHKQKYLKCHTLPLFSTFVYKEWAHRFSFLEYFIWSARNTDLVLPFYAYQKSKSEKRLATICESIRKSSINLIKNKFSLRFSNKSNCNPLLCKEKKLVSLPLYPERDIRTRDFLEVKEYENHSFTNYNSVEKQSAIFLAKQKDIRTDCFAQKAKPRFLQLRNKQGVLRFIKVNKDIGFLFHTKPNFSNIITIDIPLAKQTDMPKAYRRFVTDVKAFYSIRGFSPRRFSYSFTPKEYRVPSTEYRVTRGNISNISYSEGISLVTAQENGSAKHLQYSNFLKKSFSQNLRTKFSLVNNFVNKETFTNISKYFLYKKILRNIKPFSDFSTTPLANQNYVCSFSSLLQRGEMNAESRVRGKVCYAFNTLHQDTESTPLNKMDTQQFPRLTELLNFTGGAALRNLLSRFDLIVLGKFLRHELKNLELKVNNLLALKMLTYSQGLLLGKLAKRRSKQIRRLKLLELFHSQKSNPEWMILSVIPVLPPDLRPILRVNDDFVVASDLNRLYQTVLRRNNTIHERLDDPLPCPESGLFRQRSLQKAVDGLLENGKGGGTPLCASKRRPLVSLSHVLKGKKGLFRQHLLGKRVDYSGRSVIVVGPRLQLHECGLPKEMAIELFQPFLLHRLKVKGFATSNTTARRMIQQENPVIWHLLKQLVYEHPVLLNRAPTLHRLGIQAFQPRLVSGRAILLHPLVCNGFNADFDGDQMAVHVPLSFQARAEAWKIMWSKNNFLSPATGQPILVPSQDMVLGCYYLSVSIPRILNANVSVASHDKAMTNKVNVAYSKGVRGKRSKEGFSDPFALLGVTNGAAIRGRGYSEGILHDAFYPKEKRVSTTKQSFHNKAFLNENKGQYFSNLQDSLLAYFQGRLQTHTPFWVCIDHSFANNFVRNIPSKAKEYPAIPRVNEQFKIFDKFPLLTRYSKGVTEYENPVSGKDITRNGEAIRKFLNDEVIKVNGLITSNHQIQHAYPEGVKLVNKPNIDNLKVLKRTFLKPLYGSSREMCKTLFQNKSINNFQIRVEANETLESPLELRLNVDGNLANILTMFQNHYNYNATWVKQCKEESIKYMRTTAGRVVINDAVFNDF